MATTFSERLSAMDAMFLDIEDANVHMHMGGMAVFEAGSLRNEHGAIDLDLVLRFAEAQLHKSPRLRQKLATIPVFDRPVWIDDARFNLAYHVRHAALPPPGSMRELRRLAGRILSQALDRSKPLWEMWIVEGLEGDRFAVVSKLHHCMADGMSSGDLSGLLTGTAPRGAPGPAPLWMPRAAPDGARLVASELTRRVNAPLSLWSGPGAASEGRDAEGTSLGGSLERLATIARGAWRAAASGLEAASITPLNVDIGPHRRFDGVQLELAALKELGHAAGGTLNDAVLAIVAGVMRRFLAKRGEHVGELTFRVAVPVNVRTEADRGRLGNRVSSLVVELPIGDADPWRRLERVVETTRELKGSGESQAIDFVGRLADLLPGTAMAAISRAGNRAANMIVTNVPGPRQPIYMLTARMLESYPIVPLMANQALNIALFSYEDALFVGFLADWDAVPDLHEVVVAVPEELETLTKAAQEQAAGRAR